MKATRYILCLLLMLSGLAYSQQPVPLRVLSWNVENLFDTVHDEGFDDVEFLPQSERHWNSGRYWRKLTELSRVIAAVSDDGLVPALIGLCEVENDSVLHTLVHRSLLRSLAYEYVMTHGHDRRGINVALLYQPGRFRPLQTECITVPTAEQGLRPTRDILHVTGLIAGSRGIDTLHVFVVHLPSRTSGSEGDASRRLAAQTLWDAVLAPAAQGHVVVMGDFNAAASDRIFRHAPLRLTDDHHAKGTYAFRGHWQWIDHILISPSVQASGPARPFGMTWMLEPNKTYGGDMPRRTFRGPTYHGGVSDHLPVVIDLSF